MEWARHVVATNWVIWDLAKPVVAQIHGYCLAGGTELASICDFRIVAENAQIGYPPVRTMTTMDMMWSPWHMPMAKAREFAYVGDSHSGRQLLDLGGPTTRYRRTTWARSPKPSRAAWPTSTTTCSCTANAP
jgi:enoyl-CoA hydratase